ncbi:MAG: hypothetical protein GXN95_04730 [Methanococci archaeon]|nr:hypothetical protein [Methanococci archaeon]
MLNEIKQHLKCIKSTLKFIGSTISFIGVIYYACGYGSSYFSKGVYSILYGSVGILIGWFILFLLISIGTYFKNKERKKEVVNFLIMAWLFVMIPIVVMSLSTTLLVIGDYLIGKSNPLLVFFIKITAIFLILLSYTTVLCIDFKK